MRLTFYGVDSSNFYFNAIPIKYISIFYTLFSMNINIRRIEEIDGFLRYR